MNILPEGGKKKEKHQAVMHDLIWIFVSTCVCNEYSQFYK